MFLPDVNLWLALAFESHVHQAAAKAWFDGLSDADTCAFCRVTQQGFLRLATNPKAFADEAVTLVEAWRLYDALLADSRITLIEEPAGIEPLWRAYTSAETFTPKVWNDASLAAFARAGNHKLVTFDRGFARYADRDCVILS